MIGTLRQETVYNPTTLSGPAYAYVFNYWNARTVILQESMFNLLIKGRGGPLDIIHAHTRARERASAQLMLHANRVIIIEIRNIHLYTNTRAYAYTYIRTCVYKYVRARNKLLSFSDFSIAK